MFKFLFVLLLLVLWSLYHKHLLKGTDHIVSKKYDSLFSLFLLYNANSIFFLPLPTFVSLPWKMQSDKSGGGSLDKNRSDLAREVLLILEITLMKIKIGFFTNCHSVLYSCAKKRHSQKVFFFFENNSDYWLQID